MEVHIAPGISKRFQTILEKEYPAAGWAFGWHTSVGIICVGCVASSGTSPHDLLNDLDHSVEFLPAGLDIVGVFACGLHQYTEHEVNEFFEHLQISGFQTLTETSEFCFLTQGSQEKICRSYLYNSAEGLCLPVTVKQLDSHSLLSTCVNYHVKSILPLTYEKTALKGDEECLNECFEELKKKLSSSMVAFHLCNSQIVIQAIPEFKSSSGNVLEDTTCEELQDYVNVDDDYSVATEKKKEDKIKLLNWKVLFQTSGERAIKQTISCLPIIHHEHRKFEAVSINVPVDVMVMVPKSFVVGKLTQIFTLGICQQLNAIKQCILDNKKRNNFLGGIEIFHFQPLHCNHFISVPYPVGVAESELEIFRRTLHHRFLFNEDRPLFRRTNKYCFPEHKRSDTYLINPHESITSQGNDENISLVMGFYSYYHYMQDHFDDKGWGCAYRSLQTIISWFSHQGYTSCSIPSHKEIQQALVDVGDKPSSFINSKQWIGSLEVSYCLQHLIGVTSKIMNVSSGAELENKGRELHHHFKVQGTPIMIGGGMYAYTILGIDFNDKTGETKFLVLDPHYVGPEDINIILNKGWCGWKKNSFWDATSYYNLCLPQRPLNI